MFGKHQSKSQTEPPNGRSADEPSSLGRAWVALSGLGAVFLFEMLDNSILNVALPTIGRELRASAVALQWVTAAYSVAFGGLMLAFGSVADRFGQRRVMLIGLILLAVSSLATAVVTTPGQLIAVRVAMGVAAAMTTPGSMALAFRLFEDDGLRVRALNVITTVGLVGLAVGPTAGGFLLSVAPWQVLLLMNAPIAFLAAIAIRAGVHADRAEELHRDPLDIQGAALGTAAIVLALAAPTTFVEQGAKSWVPWTVCAAALLISLAFLVREKTTHHPLISLALVARPLVASGLAYKAAQGIGVAGLSYLVTLQLQLDLGWSPAHAAIGMLPQVAVLIAGGALVGPFVRRVGLDRAALMSATMVVAGLATYASLGTHGYVWVATSLVLVAAGTRVVGVVSGTNVLRGLPKNRTGIGAALVDTASQIATAVGFAVTGTALAAVFVGRLTSSDWDASQTAQFRDAISVAAVLLTAAAAALVVFGYRRAHNSNASDTGDVWVES